MKRILILLVVLFMIPIHTNATSIAGVKKQITPSSPYYRFDQFFDQLRIVFSKKSKLIEVEMGIAKERLDEAILMEESGELDYLDQLIREYLYYLNAVGERLLDQGMIFEYESDVKELVQLSDDLELYVTDDQKREMIKSKDIIFLATSIIKKENLDELIQIKKDYAMTTEEVLYFAQLCELTNISLTEMVGYLQNTVDISSLYGIFNLNKRDALTSAYEKSIEGYQDLYAEATESGDELKIASSQTELNSYLWRYNKHKLDESYLSKLYAFHSQYDDRDVFFMTAYEERDYHVKLREIYEEYTENYLKLYTQTY